MSIADELDRLNELREKGAISEEEFAQAKAATLAGTAGTGRTLGQAVGGLVSDENSWSMLIHLSQLCFFLLPVLGWVVPIVLWQLKKDESEHIDAHGRIVVNWILSALTYGIVSGVLILILIGIPMMFALGILSVVFPIIGTLKASRGERWPYPLSIRFFK